MTQLQWWPHDPVQWQQQTAHLSFEEAGALLHTLGVAWRDPLPCTIPASDAGLQRLLGPAWKKLRRMIEEHFTPDLENPGRLRCAWLAERHHEQMTKYEARRKPGGLGGRMRGANRGLKRGQRELFDPAGQPKAASNANENPSNATKKASIASALLTQSKEGSSPFGEEEPAVGACAAGATPPADQAEPPPWTGPDPRELQRWAAEDPERLAAVEARVDEQLLALGLGPTADTQSAKRWLRIPLLREQWRLHQPTSEAGA